MSADEQYTVAVENCEIAARSQGHTLGTWYLVDERLHASMCEICGTLALVVRPGYEKHWRTGGTALEKGCLLQEEEEEEERESELGA